MVTSPPLEALATTLYSRPGPERMFRPVSALMMIPLVPGVTAPLEGGVAAGGVGVVVLGVFVLGGVVLGVDVPLVETNTLET